MIELRFQKENREASKKGEGGEKNERTEKTMCLVILVVVIKVGDITVAVIWVGSEVWSFWSRSFQSWSFLSVF